MSKDFCMDCGMLLSPHTSVCSACGYDNICDDDQCYDIPFDMDMEFNEAVVPENYPGF